MNDIASSVLVKSSSKWRNYYLWPLIFLVALLPFAATLVQHYPDEWHYIDAVLLMLQNGDYLTPHNSYVNGDFVGGVFRLYKPILSYWAILGGFKLFGINIFGLRVSFLLAGALTVMLTALMTQRVFAKQSITELAILILMTLSSFLVTSMRAMPDILNVLFLTLSAYGIFGLLRANNHSRSSWWCFYVGAALAIESKGLLGLVFAVYALLFLWRVHPQAFKQQRATHFCAAVLALLVASSWYVIMWVEHGNLFLDAFFHDQIGLRVKHSFWLPLINIPMAGITVVGLLLPWSVIAFLAWKGRWSFFQSMIPEHSRIYRFILGWTVLLVIIFGFGRNISSRYFVFLAPLWAMVLAHMIIQSDGEWRQRLGRYFLWIMIGLLLMAGVFNFFIVGQLIGIDLGVGILLIFVGLGLWLIARACRQSVNYLKVAAWTLFFLMISAICPMYLLILPDPAEQITHALAIIPLDQNKIDFIGPSALASNIRLLSQGRINPHFLSSSAQNPPAFSGLPLLISAVNVNKLQLPNAHQKKIVLSRNLEQITPIPFIASIFTWQLATQIQLQSQEYWLIL